MTEKVSSELIDLQARQLQSLELTQKRREELAREVGGYNDTVRDAALELDFDQEPADFSKALRELSEDRNSE